MKYKFPIVKLNTEGLFGPTTKKAFYKPMTYHNKTAKINKHKTKWSLKQNEQYEVFRLSNENEWACNKNNGLFSILSNADVVIGSNEERLSFFPNPINSLDPWHGFPVNSGNYEPSVELVDKWLDDKVIDERIHIKILKCQL